MKPKIGRDWPRHQATLCDLGLERVREFSAANGLDVPDLYVVPKKNWYFDACAFYRPNEPRNRFLTSSLSDTGMASRGYGVGINICLEHCGRPCGEERGRNWSWPGSTTDRTPYGVVCHEFGHHVDWLCSEEKGTYGGTCSVNLRKESGETPISGYCPNDWEWFAEMFRLFLANHGLLRELRPKTHGLFADRWTPVGTGSWKLALGSNVPQRVVRSLTNKGAS